MAVMKIRSISLSLLDRPKNGARLEIPKVKIDELAASIKERGLLQAIRVQKRGERFEIIFGDRRFLAVSSLGWKNIPAVVAEGDNGNVTLERAVENIQRDDLTPLEEAMQYQSLTKELNVTFGELSKVTGKSPGTVKRSLNILKMPEFLQRALHERKISKGVAEELQVCPNEAQKEYLAELACVHGITVAIARQWVADYKKTLRAEKNDSEEGGSVEFSHRSEPVYVTCYLCHGPSSILETSSITVCKGCKKELANIIEKQG